MEGVIKIPQVKICGIKRIEDAEFLNEAKADYAGFVFFEKSKRNVTFTEAEAIGKKLNSDIHKVAVTVSPTVELVRKIEKLGFDILQVHGELSKEVADASRLPIWRAINITDTESLEAVFQKETDKIKEKIKGYVVDGAGYGGGKPFDWENSSERIRRLTAGKQLILAGGLDTENVKHGIRYFQPDIVDVSSSVEENGKKSKTKIDAFIRKVREDEQ